ncbi:MAG TPA: hypothetical protein PLX39_17290 [Pyrinomonadaceae bacterium]|nr:hypothetical protein [Pyrinomonadaceae bacterium]
MNDLQSVKTVWVAEPQAIVDNAPFTTATIDTKGFSKARIVFRIGATDIALAALKLTESNDSGMSGAADVSGADFSVSPLTLPSDTADNTSYAIHIDLRGRKRYLDLSATAGNGAAGTFATAFCDLYGATEHPNTAAERGFAQEAFI